MGVSSSKKIHFAYEETPVQREGKQYKQEVKESDVKLSA